MNYSVEQRLRTTDSRGAKIFSVRSPARLAKGFSRCCTPVLAWTEAPISRVTPILYSPYLSAIRVCRHFSRRRIWRRFIISLVWSIATEDSLPGALSRLHTHATFLRPLTLSRLLLMLRASLGIESLRSRIIVARWRLTRHILCHDRTYRDCMTQRPNHARGCVISRKTSFFATNIQ